MKTKTLTITATVLIFTCIAGQAMAQDKAAIEKKLKKFNKKFSEQIVNGEFTFDYYAEDAISMPQGQPMIEGVDAIKANMKKMQASGMEFKSFTSTPKKIMVNGKQVTEIGTYSLTMNVPNMPEPVKDKGKYLTLWEIRDDGELKIKVETWNSNTNPQQQ